MDLSNRSSCISLWAAVKDAAQAAAKKQDEALNIPEQRRGLDCGFAWLMIRPARGPFVAYLKSIGVGRTCDYGSGPGYSLWYSRLHDVPTQSISVHEAAIHAAAAVLRANGLDVVTGSRLD